MPKCQIAPPSVVANNEQDDYGYLNFEIDEDYERQGEFDEELDEEDDLIEDKEEENRSFTMNRKEEKNIQKNFRSFEEIRRGGQSDHQQMQQPANQQVVNKRILMSSGGFHSPYYGYHNSDVYTILEEDEEPDTDYSMDEYYGNSRRQSMNVTNKIGQHQQSDSNYENLLKQTNAPQQQTTTVAANQQPSVVLGAKTRILGQIQRMLPSASSMTTSTWSRSSFSVPSSSGHNHSDNNSSIARVLQNSNTIDQQTNKTRTMRSNSEPFLQPLIKPIKRGEPSP